jgi:biopolymer transport protein TolR
VCASPESRCRQQQSFASELFPEISIGDAPVSRRGRLMTMRKSQRAQRMETPHERGKRGGALNLVSLMDIFTILVFFLLVNSTDVEVLPNASDIQLPESIAEKRRKSVVILIGDARTYSCKGRRWRKLPMSMNKRAMTSPHCGEALVCAKRARTSPGDKGDDIAGREVTIMGDKDISYRLLKKVMATCTASDYGRISLAVVQKSSDRTDQLAAAR